MTSRHPCKAVIELFVCFTYRGLSESWRVVIAVWYSDDYFGIYSQTVSLHVCCLYHQSVLWEFLLGRHTISVTHQMDSLNTLLSFSNHKTLNLYRAWHSDEKVILISLLCPLSKYLQNKLCFCVPPMLNNFSWKPRICSFITGIICILNIDSQIWVSSSLQPYPTANDRQFLLLVKWLRDQ